MSADTNKKRGLGRGLDALFGDKKSGADHAPDAAMPERPVVKGKQPQASVVKAAPPLSVSPDLPSAAAPRGASLRKVSVERLTPGSFQPRRRFSDDTIDQLADSIAVHGILQPLVVRPLTSDPESPQALFEIIAGERRWRAAQKAQLHEVPVIVRDLDDQQALEFGLIENLQREDLTPIEEAEGYERLMQDFGHTQEQLARQLGKSRSHIANTLRLLKLPASIRSRVMDGSLSAGHARALVGCKNAEEIAAAVVKRGLSVRQTEKLVQQAGEGKPAAGKSRGRVQAFRQKDVDILALEERMAGLLGLRVTIDAAESGAGRITIDYASLDQLDDVIARLSTPPRA